LSLALRPAAAAAALAALAAGRAAAQPPADTAHAHPAAHAPPAERPRASVQAVAQGARTNAAYAGAPRAEASLTQPVVMAHAPLAGGRVRVTTTLNFEALTLRGGQLNPGIYGEGFVDRRHPHTVVHELVASAGGRVPGVRGVEASLSAGKGFVAFGTDDPMVRPFSLFPVNHHLAQLLERYVVTAAVRAARPGLGDALVEASAFGGDEPAGPWRWPRLRRFGDAWALRATLRPRLGGPAPGAPPGPLELSASAAGVPSPENPLGEGLDQRKASLAARWARGAPLGGAGLGGRGDGDYALVEWARTDELRAGRRAFRYESVLAEAAARRRGVELAARWERTTRPEEERVVDPFRTRRPHNEFSLLGLTEWRTATASLGVPARAGALRAFPFVELARAVPREVLRPSAFDPRAFYGARALWTVVVGARLGLGAPHARMGRYGVAAGRGHAGRGPHH
jgi:hypothetical protein